MARRGRPRLDRTLRCALGEVFLGRHPLCQQATANLCSVPLSEVPLPDYSRYAVWTQASLFPERNHP